jgi:hypothetical protein
MHSPTLIRQLAVDAPTAVKWLRSTGPALLGPHPMKSRF